MPRYERHYYTYILGSVSGVLYVGVTGDLFHRLRQHREEVNKGFTSLYNVNQLLWYEEYGSAYEAILREKQIKRWRREKKLALIWLMNPKGEDLSKGWYDDPRKQRVIEHRNGDHETI